MEKKVEKDCFEKQEYQEAKQFLRDHKATINGGLTTTTFIATDYILDNGERWVEFESRLEAPYDDYRLEKAQS